MMARIRHCTQTTEREEKFSVKVGILGGVERLS